MNTKVYNGSVARLRRAERLQVMQVERVVELCLKQDDFKTVLDCGTGSGVFAEAFLKKGLTVIGIDLNPEMIAAARAYVLGGRFNVARLERLPFREKSFDLLFYAHSLHEAGDLCLALAEAKRVARRHVMALEWPVRFKLHGPPVGHRIRVRELRGILRRLQFQALMVESIGGQNLYIMAI
ncbi:MAG TPA: class I SAM-dependent methyltransferase [Candidatus Marinimicrobia bacterium]|nr:class I SAM-dependent methyltransferase [Candidatus Neomarinimicrobiota bacterium]